MSREHVHEYIDVYRDETLVSSVPNTGVDIDSTGDTGRDRYVYDVCEANTSTCSNKVKVTFRR